MNVPDLLILRHGETVWNACGRMQGEKDSPLTDTGRAQAARQRDILDAFGVADWTAYSSPQGRALATADVALSGLGLEVTVDGRLREITLGRWSGLQRAEIRTEAPHLFETDDLIWYDHAPGGEGLARLAERAQAFLADLTGPSVVVTHGITSRILRCHALGRPWETFGELEGGQGVVHHLSKGVAKLLD